MAPMVVAGEQCVARPAVGPGLLVGSSSILFFYTEQVLTWLPTACSFWLLSMWREILAAVPTAYGGSVAVCGGQLVAL